jgi:dienelactone hydrolase
MKMKQTPVIALLIGAMAFISCNNNNKAPGKQPDGETKQPNIKEEAVAYTADTAHMNGFVTYNENNEGKRPGILVIPEWWGLSDYIRSRAKQLAEMGYIAMAVDMYGNAQTADNPQRAQELSTPFYKDPNLAKTRLDAALVKLKSYAQTDTADIAAIGYCFGGYVVINAAKLGSDLKGVVSFHGGLSGAPANKDLLKAKILVCHGEKDNFVPPAEVNAFKKQMDSIGADYTFKVYPNSTHAFTNPIADEWGKKFNMPVAYNAAADTASWNDMKAFFSKIFGSANP